MSTRVCPICHQEYSQYPALSRRDNKTEICPDCGVREALEDWHNYLTHIINKQT